MICSLQNLVVKPFDGKSELTEIEGDLRAAIHSERARRAAAVHGNFHVAGRAEHGDRLSWIARSKCLGKLEDLLAIHSKLDWPTPERTDGNIFRSEIRHQISECIDA